tara:strand:- start:602 stop:826 length:225 start_codon:yes stop_codon:yes gene_type:complete
MKYIPNGTPRIEEIEILLNAGLFWLHADNDEDPDDPRDAKATAEECFVEAHAIAVYLLEQQQKQNEDNAKQNIT